MTISPTVLTPEEWDDIYETEIDILKNIEGYEESRAGGGDYLDPIAIPAVGYGYALIFKGTLGGVA